MSIPGLKYWIILMAVLVLPLVYFSLTGDGSFSFSWPGSLIAAGIIALAAYNWGGWKRS